MGDARQRQKKEAMYLFFLALSRRKIRHERGVREVGLGGGRGWGRGGGGWTVFVGRIDDGDV